jgi:arsenate reductase
LTRAGSASALSRGAMCSASSSLIGPAATAEIGIDITAAAPKVLTGQAVEASDVVITMGCGDACPYFPGVSYRDWKLDDPAGQPIDVVRRIRDDIAERVKALIDELAPG